jgi:hypothetical protein
MQSLVGPDLPRLLVDFSRLSLWLAILVAIFVPLERFFSVHPKKIRDFSLNTTSDSRTRQSRSHGPPWECRLRRS